MIIGLDTASDRWHATVRADSICPVPRNFKAHYPNKGESRGWSPDERREHLLDSFDEFLQFIQSEMVHGEEVYIFCEESQAFGSNGKTTRMLNMVTGALWAAARRYPFYWFWVGSSQWKKMTGTSGKKKAIAYPLEKAWCIERGAEDGWDQDHYVSFACAEYGHQALLEAMLK